MTTVPAPVHRSHSQIKTYLHCPHQYLLERVVKVPQTPAWFLIGGSAVHVVVELLTKYPETPEENIAEAWDIAWSEEVKKAEQNTDAPREQWRAAGRVTKDKPNKEDGEWWQAEGLHMCLRYHQWLSGVLYDGWQVFDDGQGPWVERGVNTTVGGAPVKMFLDSLFVMPGGELCVVDAKTGSRVPDAQQLRLYALGLDRVGQPRPSHGAYWMARTGQLHPPFSLDEQQDKVIDSTFRDVDAAIKAGLFPAHVSSMCSGCSVNTACAAYGGAEAHKYDPILTEGSVD